MRLHPLLLAALFASGCIFGGSSIDDDEDMSRPDASRPDVGTDMRDSGTGDVSRPDLDPPADVGPDVSRDTGMPPAYAFSPLRPVDLGVPVRADFIPLSIGASSALSPQLIAMIAHWRVVWGTDLEAVDVTAADLPSVNFALLSNEASQDPENMLPEVEDLDGTPWSNPTVPLLVVRPDLFDDTQLMQGPVFAEANPLLEVVDAQDPLARDLPTNFRGFDNASSAPLVSLSTRAGGVEPIQFNSNGAPWPALLGVEAGGSLPDGDDARARRVALGLEAAHNYTWEGWTIFDNSVAWLTNTPIRPAAVDCVVVGPPGDAFRFHIAARARRNGCRVSFTPGDITDDTVVIIVPGVNGSAIGDLARHSGPVVVVFSAPDVLSTFSLADPGGPIPAAAAYWTIDGAAPAWIRANQSGDVQVQDSASILPVTATDSVAPGATIIATILDQPGSTTYFVVEADAELNNGSDAYGDRVAIGMTGLTFAQATTSGFSFFDAAVQWSVQRAAEGM